MIWIACFTSEYENSWEKFDSEEVALKWLREMEDAYAFNNENESLNFEGFVALTTKQLKEHVIGKRSEFSEEEFNEKFPGVNSNVDFVVNYILEDVSGIGRPYFEPKGG